MKILLTGATGMVGKNFLAHVLSKQYEILTPTSLELDLTNYGETSNYLKATKPHLIIHAAGLVGGIQANMRIPYQFFIKNLDVGRNVIHAAYQSGIDKVINIGSSCMYPRNAPNPLKEQYILQGELEPTNEGYALAKLAVAKMCFFMSQEDPRYQYKTIIPCNLYGKWDKFDEAKSHLIPAIVHKIHKAKINGEPAIDIWGEGTARREFMFAEDLADFLYFSIVHYDKLHAFTNVGPGIDYSINDYYKIASDVIGYEGKFHHDLSKPVGMQQKLLDVELLHQLGWFSKINLEQGIKETYDYYLQLEM